MDELKLKLSVFEGPLDLLLHLIKTLEIDIYDIPIADITEQYLAYIHTMQTLALDVAGDYLIMAATLMAIKSKMLLPKQELEMSAEDEITEEGEDPRAALVAQLLEYRKFKYAAELLKDREEERSLYFTKEPVDLSSFKKQVVPLDPNEMTPIDLFLAFHDMLERKRQHSPQETTIAADVVSVEEKIELIKIQLSHLGPKQSLLFDDLFVSHQRSEIIATFMAMLELVKNGDVKITQAERTAPIFLYTNFTEEDINYE